MIVIAGHGRYTAAKLLGLEQVSVVEVRGLSEAKRRALALADNKIAENAGWACPVAALKAWLEAAGTTTGPIFRSVKKGGAVSGRLPAQSVAEIVKAYAVRVGLDPALFAGHSVRSGFLTSAAKRERLDLQDDGSVTSPVGRDTARLRPRRGNLQGARGALASCDVSQ